MNAATMGNSEIACSNLEPERNPAVGRGDQQRHPWRTPSMHKILLSAAAAAAIVSSIAFSPSGANAMGVGTAAAIDDAIEGLNTVEAVPYVCRWRYGSRR